MLHSLIQRTIVKPGGIIELSSPDFKPGSIAEVIVTIEEKNIEE